MKELQMVLVKPSSGERVVLANWYMEGDNPFQYVHRLNVETDIDHWEELLWLPVALAPGSYIVLEDVTKPPWPTPIEFI